MSDRTVNEDVPIKVNPPTAFVAACDAEIVPGNVATATTTFTNAFSEEETDVTMAFMAPAGFTVAATSPATFESVAAGESVTTTWSIAVPATAPERTKISLSATADFSIGDFQAGQLTA